MFWIVSNLLIILFEVFCYKIFWEIFSFKRKQLNKWRSCCAILFLMSSIYLIATYLSGYFVLKQLSITSLFIVTTYLYTKEGIGKVAVVATLYQGLLLVVDYVAFSVNSILFYNDELIIQYYVAKGMLVVVLGKVTLFLCILVIKKKMGKKSAEILTDTEWIRFLFFPVFTILTITAMITSFRYVANQTQANILFVIAFGMAGMNVVVFYLINDIVKRAIQNNERKMLEVQVKSQTEMYQAISEHYDKQRRKVHEFKNQIMCIESLFRKKQYDELEQYINKISGKFMNEKDAINSNHVIINAVINTKYQEAIHKHIVFVFRVNDLSNIIISDQDVVVILSNLLNNAIEACVKCEDNKVLKLKFLKEKGEVVLSVKNTFSQPMIYDGNSLKTTKSLMPEEHGLGIKNIIKIIEKYGGSYVIKIDEKEFYFSIVIPE